ncbi:hypothetical protein IFM89_001770, partial [Coptis chinensis]
MSLKEVELQTTDDGLTTNDGFPSTIKTESVVAYQAARDSTDKDGGLPICRVCQCSESDSKGEAALGYLDIFPPLQELPKTDVDRRSNSKDTPKFGKRDTIHARTSLQKAGVLEFVNTEGEVFICTTDIEAGSYTHQDTVIDLGCSCKNDLALAHYACALKWFINHGSTVCEICESVAKNIRLSDFKKVVTSLKEYESLRERTLSGERTLANVEINSGVDPVAVASVRRQRLREVSLWFTPHIFNNHTSSTTISQGGLGHSNNTLFDSALPSENCATKWAVEGTGILVATGLLTVTIAWLLAPHVGKACFQFLDFDKITKNGLHILLGGVCALTIVLFLRFIVLSRIKYGPARYWAILFVFWFLVFGIWASRTHGSHA